MRIDTIKKLFNGEIIPVTGKIHSPEHNQGLNIQGAKLQLFKERDNPDRFHLSLNGQNILDWFKEQFGKLRQMVKPNIKPVQPTQKKERKKERRGGVVHIMVNGK